MKRIVAMALIALLVLAAFPAVAGAAIGDITLYTTIVDLAWSSGGPEQLTRGEVHRNEPYELPAGLDLSDPTAIDKYIDPTMSNTTIERALFTIYIEIDGVLGKDFDEIEWQIASDTPSTLCTTADLEDADYGEGNWGSLGISANKTFVKVAMTFASRPTGTTEWTPNPRAAQMIFASYNGGVLVGTPAVFVPPANLAAFIPPPATYVPSGVVAPTTSDGHNVPAPIVPVIYDIVKTGDSFSFKTIIANAGGGMRGATVNVRLNEKYSTTVTIGEDGIGLGTIEAPGITSGPANFSSRVNGVGHSTTKIMTVRSDGLVVSKN